MAYSIFFYPVREWTRPAARYYQQMSIIFLLASFASFPANYKVMKKTMTYFEYPEFDRIKSDFAKSVFNLNDDRDDKSSLISNN